MGLRLEGGVIHWRQWRLCSGSGGSGGRLLVGARDCILTLLGITTSIGRHLVVVVIGVAVATVLLLLLLVPLVILLLLLQVRRVTLHCGVLRRLRCALIGRCSLGC